MIAPLGVEQDLLHWGDQGLSEAGPAERLAYSRSCGDSAHHFGSVY